LRVQTRIVGVGTVHTQHLNTQQGLGQWQQPYAAPVCRLMVFILIIPDPEGMES